jgi:universal bacterial protein YeaZ
MKSLILDTSSKYLVVALYIDNELIEAFQEVGNSRQSENAIPVIEKLLSNQNLGLFDIDELIVTIGPGSYTGVRVGLSIVKTLKTIHPFKVKVVSSLLAYAGNDACISIIDARSKQIYIGIYNNGLPLIDETIIPIDEFNDFIQNYSDFKVVGDLELVGRKENQDLNLYQNIYILKDKLPDVNDIHQVIPNYIKGFGV